MWWWFTLVFLKMQEKLHFTFNTSGWRLIHKMWPWSKAFSGAVVLKKLHFSVQALSVGTMGTEILFSACAVCYLRGVYSVVCFTVNVGSATRYHCKYEHDLHLPGTAWYEDMMIWLWTDQVGSSRHCKPIFLLFLPSSPCGKKEIGTWTICQGNSRHAHWVQGQEEKPALPEVPQWRVPAELSPIWIYFFHFCFTCQHLFPRSTLIWLKFLWHQSFHKLLLSLVPSVAALSKVKIFQLSY